MSYQRPHQTYPIPQNGWDSYFSSRTSSLLGSSSTKRHPSTIATSDRKRPRLVENDPSSIHKDMLPASIPTLSSTLPQISSRQRSAFKDTSSSLALTEDTSDSFCKLNEPSSAQQPRIVKPKAISLYQQQDGNSSDESIDTYLKRIENGTPSRPKHTKKAGLYQQQQQQQQQQDDSDSEESIGTYLERIENGAPRRPKHKTKGNPYQPTDDDLSLSDTTTPQLHSTNAKEDTVPPTTTRDPKDAYYDLFGKPRRPKMPKKQMNKRQRENSTDQQQLLLDMKTILEAISVEPLPTSGLNDELDFFAEEEQEPRGKTKKQQRRREHVLVNGFNGFSDEEGSIDDQG